MDKKKFDINSLIGILLIGALLFWFMRPKDETAKDKKESQTEQIAPETKTADAQVAPSDSTKVVNTGYFASNDAAKTIEVKTDVQTIEFSTKGGFISSMELNNQHRFNKQNPEMVHLIADNNSKLNLTFQTKDGRMVATKDLIFEPTITKAGEKTVVSMKALVSDSQYLEYVYEIANNDYMMDFTIRSVGLSSVLNLAVEPTLDWTMKAFNNEKSKSYENRYTEIVYEYEEGKDDYLNASKTTTETPVDVTYIAFKQHLFTSILLTDRAFSKATVSQENLVKNDDTPGEFLKDFKAEMPIAYQGGEFNEKMNFYFGPSDYNILNAYDRNLDEVLNLGWGIFGFLNRYLFIPIFSFIVKFVPYGLAIILLTVVIRLLMSPIQYKSYVSQAKMKIIRPEVQEIAEKYKKDPMKKQQETMRLYSKAGVSPLAGCLPMFLQLPVFYALFMFFPSAFDLRQKSFLWADDLSSYDSIAQLPFSIPFYGSHVSLFPILAALATFVYMKMTTGDQSAMQPQQEGMPDMSKLMKIMIYISPLMMLFFFNNYASGLSLYYFISNLITIGIMYVIKNKIVNEDKVRAIIEENKTKEKPKSKFQRRMEKMMEEAQKQKQNK